MSDELAHRTDEEVCTQIKIEALRCRVAYESFTSMLYGDIVSRGEKSNFYWFMLEQQYIAWIAHLYEVLKLCLERDIGLAPGGLHSWVKKYFCIKDSRKISLKINAMIDEGAKVAFNNDISSSDTNVVWLDGFSVSIAKIRNKHFAHHDKERVKLSILTEFGDSYYYAAFSCYKQCVLPWAKLNSMPGDIYESVEAFRKSIRNIPKGKFDR